MARTCIYCLTKNIFGMPSGGGLDDDVNDDQELQLILSKTMEEAASPTVVVDGTKPQSATSAQCYGPDDVPASILEVDPEDVESEFDDISLKSATGSASYASVPAAVPVEEKSLKPLFGSKSLAVRFPEFLTLFQECVQDSSSGYGLAAHNRRRDSDGILTGINLGKISEYILEKIPELRQQGIRLAKSTVYSYLKPANKAVASRRGETGQPDLT